MNHLRSHNPVSLIVILGSGLAGACDDFTAVESFSFEVIPGAKPPGVAGHAGEIRKCEENGADVWFVIGRKHVYENGDGELCAVLDSLKDRGATHLLITSAAGSLNRTFRKGEIALACGIIDLQCRKPGGRGRMAVSSDRNKHRYLRGSSVKMERPIGSACCASRMYEVGFDSLLNEAAFRAGVILQKGVLACMPGPAYETPAEVRALTYFGADLVSMSAASELEYAAIHRIPAGALAVVTNLATGLAKTAPAHNDVLASAKPAGRDLGRIVKHLVKLL